MNVHYDSVASDSLSLTSMLTPSGHTISYHRDGPPESPFAYLLLHGLGSDWTTMETIRQHLLDKDQPVIVVDLPGHGSTTDHPQTGTFGILEYAEDLKFMLHELEIRTVSLVGHSMGGITAVALASLGQVAVERVILLDPGIFMPEERREGLDNFYDSLEEGDFRARVHEFVPSMYEEGDPKEMIEVASARTARMKPEVFIAIGRSLLALDTAAVAEAVTAPTLMIIPSVPFADMDWLHRTVPDWYVGRVVGSGHFIQTFATAQVNAMIDRFLEISQ